ncbi:hypothetical protein N7478_006879 [Penicillium angulare]|uniref:uncharacterized protein n=1 Tax=Penicillium angulare TaxID=116970 RepID=UPI0025406D21|nr:uncharacterized protein N7478_006879 [Penicillium angulare]KAJ5281507.1 hypothetical protein N7478_006879 [Penicillium angulare]
MAASQYAGLAATWTLETGTVPPIEGMIVIPAGSLDSVFEPDFRSRVDQNDYRDGGKYRSIVKLEMSYEGMPSGSEMASMGTGWLIRPDLLVTAGQCVYDHFGNDGQGFGRVRVMQCHIGYNGRDSLKGRSVQTRFAKKVVTTGEWIESRDNRHRDVAFIQLEKPFTGELRLFSYIDTPTKGVDMIGVVGYPGDMHLEDSEGIDEIGAQMYELFQETRYDLNDNALKMLQYRVSTFGGQSGSPVLRKKTPQVSMGAHSYGGVDKNSASPIGGQSGNDYNTYISAFSTSYPSVKSVAGVDFVNPSPSDVPDPDNNPGNEEVFFDDLKSIVGIVAQVGKVTFPLPSPLLGPLGGPLSAVAGSALSVVTNATAAGSEPVILSPQQVAQNATERAVLAEATLQSVIRITDQDVAQKLFQDMKVAYSKLTPDITNLVPKMTPLLKDSALRLAVSQDYLRKSDNVKLGSPTEIPYSTDFVNTSFRSPPFVDGLMEATRPVVGEEGFFDGLGSFLNKAVAKEAPYGLQGAKIGLHCLDNALAPSGDNSVSQTSHDDKNDILATTLLFKRAIMAEAALRAVMKLDKTDLARASDTEVESMYGPGGFFGDIKSTVQVIGSAVSKAAPKVIGTLLPIAAGALGKKGPGSSNGNFLSSPPVNNKS